MRGGNGVYKKRLPEGWLLSTSGSRATALKPFIPKFWPRRSATTGVTITLPITTVNQHLKRPTVLRSRYISRQVQKLYCQQNLAAGYARPAPDAAEVATDGPLFSSHARRRLHCSLAIFFGGS